MAATSSRSLRAFLEQPARPAGTLTYHELQGFLFAVVSAPGLIQPSEWLPIIFNEHEAGFATLEEANAILGHLMKLYNEINAAVLEERATLPGDCRVRAHVLDNLADSAPLARWSRGFVLGHQWLEDLWDVDLPEDWDDELGAVLMTLSFFSSRDLAEAFHRESALGTESLEGLAESVLRVLPDALAEYAHLGRSILGGAPETSAQTPRQSAKVRRNDPCPCGSGKKFKMASPRARTRRSSTSMTRTGRTA